MASLKDNRFIQANTTLAAVGIILVGIVVFLVLQYWH